MPFAPSVRTRSVNPSTLLRAGQDSSLRLRLALNDSDGRESSLSLATLPLVSALDSEPVNAYKTSCKKRRSCIIVVQSTHRPAEKKKEKKSVRTLCLGVFVAQIPVSPQRSQRGAEISHQPVNKSTNQLARTGIDRIFRMGIQTTDERSLP